MRLRFLSLSSPLLAASLMSCAGTPPPTDREAPERSALTTAPMEVHASTDPSSAPVSSGSSSASASTGTSSAPASSSVATERRKPTYPETHCPAGMIADGNMRDLECHCCKPFGIPCPDSPVLAPRPEGQCNVYGSENDICLWKCE